jgi:hypothetical protein
MAFSKNNHVIQTIPPDRSNQSLDKGTLPRALSSCQDLLSVHSAHTLWEKVSIDLVAISQQVLRGTVLRKCFNNLLSCPELSWVFSDVKVNHPPTMMRQHHKHKKHSKGNGGNREEIDRNQVFEMIIEKSAPGQ